MDTMTAGLGVLVGAAAPVDHATADDPMAVSPTVSAISTLYYLGSVVANPMLAYHGYVRNDESWGWALGWLFAPIPWPVQALIARHQGFAKLDPKLGSGARGAAAYR